MVTIQVYLVSKLARENKMATQLILANFFLLQYLTPRGHQDKEDAQLTFPGFHFETEAKVDFPSVYT